MHMCMYTEVDSWSGLGLAERQIYIPQTVNNFGGSLASCMYMYMHMHVHMYTHVYKCSYRICLLVCVHVSNSVSVRLFGRLDGRMTLAPHS